MEDDLNHIVQSLWIGGKLSKVEQLCIQSFLDNGHAFHLYAYEPILNAPEGTRIMDARLIMPEDAIFVYKSGWGTGSVSGFADVFRLMLIQKNGGWWVDMDIICLKPLDLIADTVFCSSFEENYGQVVNNCIFKAPKNCDFIRFCLEEIDKIDLGTMSFGMAGPFLFQKAVRELQLGANIYTYEYFNPISWKNVGELILGKMTLKATVKEVFRPIFKPGTMRGRRLSPQSYTVHYWNEVWTVNQFDKNGTYHARSLFERLKKRHRIS
jgi:hypothetical protein